MIQILQELSILCLNTIFMLFFLLINIYHKEIYFTIDSTTLFIKAHIIAKQPIKFLYTTICKSSILFRLLSLILICGLCLCLFFYLTKNFSLIISTILVIPYAGSVKLAGLTIEEAKQVLTAKFGKYIKIPDMSIIVTNYGPRKVQVLGEVNAPGTVELASDDMNVLAAISKAEWVTTYGRIKKVQVIRIDDGVMYVKEANIKDYIEKHDISQNFALEDGDIIYIPKSNKIDFHKDVLPLINVYSTYRALTD